MLRTKVTGTDEGGVAAGYAFLSSPLLCDDEALFADAETETQTNKRQRVA